MAPLPQPPAHPPRGPEQFSTGPVTDGLWHRMHPLTAWSGANPSSLIPLVVSAAFISSWVSRGRGEQAVFITAAFVIAAFVGIIVWQLVDYSRRSFRVTPDACELRSGIITKDHRQVRTDRLQSVNINRGIFARMLGLATVKISSAGHESDINLRYLREDDAELLRGYLLRQSSGLRTQAAHEGSGPRRVGSPEAAPHPAPAPAANLTDRIDAIAAEVQQPTDALVRVPQVRQFFATMLSVGSPLILLILIESVGSGAVVALINLLDHDSRNHALSLATAALVGGAFAVLFVIVLVMVCIKQMLTNGNFAVASTRDGLQFLRGWTTLTSDTLPPGRIHAVQIEQPLLWRLFGWYRIRINRADIQVFTTGNDSKDAAAAARHEVLPVGKRDDVLRMLEVLLPMHMSHEMVAIVDDGMARGRRGAFTWAPGRAFWRHPWMWRRLGFLQHRDVVYFRRGRFRRAFTIVPGERMQSVTARQGVIARWLKLGRLQANTVRGPAVTHVDGVDEAVLYPSAFDIEELSLRAESRDTSHRWRETKALSLLAAAHIRAEDAKRSGAAVDDLTRRILAAEAEFRSAPAADGMRR